MAQRGIIGPAIKVVFLAVIIFFVLFFLVPDSAELFFGTSVRSARVAEAAEAAVDTVSDMTMDDAVNAVASYIRSIDPSVAVDQAKALASSPEFSQIVDQVQEKGSAAVSQAAEAIISTIQENRQ